MTLQTVSRLTLRTVAAGHRVARHVALRSDAATSIAQARTRFYHAVWQQAAQELDGHVVYIGSGYLDVEAGSVRLRVKDEMTSLDDPVTLEIAGDKPLVLRMLSEAGIPVPRHVVVKHHDLAGAWTFASCLSGPCVVKPALHGAAGAGVTTGVDDRRRLRAALAHAGAWSREALVEQQVEADVYRLLYLDGELLDAVVRRPPVLRGDGHSSIRRLIDDENAARLRRGTDLAQSLLRRDADVSAVLARQGFSRRSVPPSGAAVQVDAIPNDNRKLDNQRVTDALCPEIVATGAAAARAIGVRLAGVDIITSDPGEALECSGGVVIEVNTTPGFYYHYHRRGSAANVATMILRRLAEGRR